MEASQDLENSQAAATWQIYVETVRKEILKNESEKGQLSFVQNFSCSCHFMSWSVTTSCPISCSVKHEDTDVM